MAKIEIGAWEIAEKFGLSYVGEEEVPNKWHDYDDYHVFDFHRKRIRLEVKAHSDRALESYMGQAAEIVLFNIGKVVASDMTDWAE